TDHLTESLIMMSNLSEYKRNEMSEAGFELSKQFKPERWASTLMKLIGTDNNTVLAAETGNTAKLS
ncbi:MAG: hypothetical protein WD491_13110, partial [Balneolales bacterium]